MPILWAPYETCNRRQFGDQAAAGDYEQVGLTPSGAERVFGRLARAFGKGARRGTIRGLVSRLPRWPRSVAHAKGHAVVLAVMLWTGAAIVGFVGSGARGVAGPLKGPDFVQFYTLGHLASSRQIDPMYDAARFYDAQVALLPESRGDIYPPVYPPHAAVMFAPAAAMSYQRALLLWSAITIVGYTLILWSAWRVVADVLPDRTLIVAAAAAFPPFWSLVLHGQVTIVLLAAFWAGWLALERKRPWLAGMAFGLLALKPQFGIPLAVVVLACREWKMLAGAVASVCAQAAAVWLVLGPAVFKGFVAWIPTMMAYADQLEAKPFMSHSLRAMTRIAPDWIGLPVWVLLAAVVLWYTVRVWKSEAPLRVRLAAVIVASVLVNPHVLIYDLAVLALPIVWLGAYVQEPAKGSALDIPAEPLAGCQHLFHPTAQEMRGGGPGLARSARLGPPCGSQRVQNSRNEPHGGPERREHQVAYWMIVYWLFATTFMPTAAAIGLQVSVLLMMWLLVLTVRMVGDPRVPTGC